MELIVVGGVLFWIVTLFVLLAIFYGVEHDSPIISTGSVILFAAFLQCFSNLPVLTLALSQPSVALLWLAGYLAFGVVWGVVKWLSFVYRVRDAFTDKKVENLAHWIDYKRTELVQDGAMSARGIAETADDVKRKFGLRSLPPKPGDKKSSITLWMMYWPVSVAWTFLDDPVRRFFAFAYRKISGFLQGISNRAFEGHMTAAAPKVPSDPV